MYIHIAAWQYTDHRQILNLLYLRALMEINGPFPSLPNLTATVAQLQNLRIGQLLQAVVIKQLTSETVLLQLLPPPQPTPQTARGQAAPPLQFSAETPRPLATGEQLQLEVVRLGDKPLLKVLSQMSAADAPLKQALLQALPRQESMTPLLANLRWINQQGAAAPLPQAVQHLAKELFEKLPSREKVSSADGLKTAIKDSGLLLENKMGQAAQKGGAPESEHDLKALLLRLLNTVQRESTQATSTSPSLIMPAAEAQPRSPVPATPPLPQIPSPPVPGGRPQPQGRSEATLATLNNTLLLLQELGKQGEGGVARTLLHQIASLPTPDQNPLTWSFELPVRNQERVDLFQFLIEEHKESDKEQGEQKRRWNVTIAFDLEGLGPMYARLQLENGRIGTTFWADSFDTSTLISQNLTGLAQRFKEAGLESGELRCFQGQPPEASNTSLPRIVLDVKA